MRIILHVGPHKTGTTSVQQWLIEKADAHFESAGVYLPVPNNPAMGHAELAADLLGLWREQSNESVKQVCEEAVNAQASTLVLSSENFSMAAVKGLHQAFDLLAAYGEIEVVLTLTPLSMRFVSESVELVKHGAKNDLDNMDIVGFCMRRGGLHPSFLPFFLDKVQASKRHVVIARKADAMFLYQSMADIVGVPVPPESTVRNMRAPASFTRTLDLLNRQLPDATRKQRQDIAQSMVEVLRKEGLDDKFHDVAISKKDKEYLDGLWETQMMLLQSLGDSGAITLYR